MRWNKPVRARWSEGDKQGVAGGCLFGVLALLLIFGIAAFPAFLFMVMWNLVVPAAFGGVELSFWQSFALLFLLSIIGSVVGAFCGK